MEDRAGGTRKKKGMKCGLKGDIGRKDVVCINNIKDWDCFFIII